MESSQPIERRSHPRRPVSGQITIRQSGAISASFVGHLIDLSAMGFRVRHHCLNLASGQLVHFQWEATHGQARTVWTRIVGNEAETGFHIVQRDG